jgi:D-alanyl-lipoteichoic acid acyltransferase DltB (MBOAT superfamily)
MLFNSLEFAVFFPIVAGLYFLLPYRHRTVLLLVSSCVFYMAFIPAYILILGITILIDYAAGLWLERTVAPGRRRLLLFSSIVATCAVLFVFKYFDFFVGNARSFAGLFGWQLTGPSMSIILPIGLSFHTFQSLSYVIEVFNGRQKAEHNFLTYATYVMFFPQLVAGPIERPQNLLHQFNERHDFDYVRITSGLKRMAWGFFKKLVVADRLALYVNDVYAVPQDHNGLQLTLATVFFAYQIYCDFSGYSDIAIGSARVLGFRLMENFRRPYHAESISAFWQRWHISLSSWFRDYVYVPLGGNRALRPVWFRNLLLTFTISGLWHGANWTYVVWGFVNGVYLVSGVILKPLRGRLWALVGVQGPHALRTAAGVVMVFVLSCLAWTIFRAQNLGDALYVLSHFWRGWDVSAIATPQFLLRQLPVAVLSIVVLELVESLNQRVSVTALLARQPTVMRWSVYTSFVLGVILFGIYRHSQFIYFQF